MKLLQITAFSGGITILDQRIILKDDIEFVTEFPCLLGHPAIEIIYYALFSYNLLFSYSLSEVEVYNMVTEEWRTINTMNIARFYPGLYVVDNILTVFGGAGGTSSRSIEYLNAAGNWEMSNDNLEKYFNDGDSVAIKCPA